MFDINQIAFFLLIFFRVGAILFTAPFFGNKNINSRTRVLIAFAIAVVLAIPLKALINENSAIADSIPSINNYPSLVLAIFREIMLGVAVGYTAQLVFTGIQFAGQLVGHEVGFSMMNVLDPSTASNVNITTQFNMVLSTMVFLLIDGHHYILMSIAESFYKIPLGRWSISSAFIGHLNDLFAGIFITAIRISLPVMGAVFLSKIAMSIIARTMPQMNVFIVGAPIQIALGLIAMAISLPFFVKLLVMLFTSMREDVFLIFKLQSWI